VECYRDVDSRDRNPKPWEVSGIVSWRISATPSVRAETEEIDLAIKHLRSQVNRSGNAFNGRLWICYRNGPLFYCGKSRVTEARRQEVIEGEETSYKEFHKGRAVAQAVSRRLPTAAVRVQIRIWSCGILWWTKVALGQVLSVNFGFPCQSTFHLLLHNHLHYHARLTQ
jgi:hypothetical protein